MKRAGISTTLLGLVSLLGVPAGPAEARSRTRARVISPLLGTKAWKKRIKQRYQPSSKGYRLVTRFGGRPLKLPLPSTVQIQYGWGHGFYLVFQQWRLAITGVRVEEVEWNGRQRTPGSARRVRTTLGKAHALLGAVATLRTVRLAERKPRPMTPKKGWGTFSMGGWSSSGDFYVLVRVLDAKQRALFEREFCGYAGSTAQLRYLPLVVTRSIAQETVKTITGWRKVASSKLRTTHFPWAYNMNSKIMLKSFHWWLMEYSTEALGTFGTRVALKGVKFVRRRYSKLLPRQRKKLDALLKRPNHWLKGAPKIIKVP